MLHLDEDKLTLKQIREYSGSCYFMNNLKEILNDFQSTPPPSGTLKLEYGGRYKRQQNAIVGNRKTTISEKKKGILMPLSYPVQTEDGTKMFTYSETARTTKDGMKFEPKKKKFDGNWPLHYQRDAELLLFMLAVSPEVKTGEILINNPVKKADEFEKERSKVGSLDFYLYNADSPIYDNKAAIKDIAMAWGCPVDDASTIKVIKRDIYKSVELAEKRKDASRNINAFVSAVKGQLPFMEELVLIQKAIDGKHLRFDDGNNQYLLKSGTKERRLAVINPSKIHQKAEILADWLTRNEDVIHIIKGLLGGESDDKLNYDVLADGEYSDFETMEWKDMKRVAGKMGMPYNASKKDILSEIKAFYDNQ